MKIAEYNQMKKWLTRPDSLPLAERKAIELKQAKAEQDRKNKKRAEYDLPPLIDPKHFVEVSNKYDGTNYVVDGGGNIVEEKDLIKKFDNNDPTTYPSNPEQRRKLLTPQKVEVPKKPKQKEKQKTKTNYADIKIPTVSVETYKSIIQPEDPKPQQVPEARHTGPIENDPQYRNTIFGSDTFYRRMRKL